MTSFLKHVVHHGPVLSGLGKTFVAASRQKKGTSGAVPPTPGPERHVTLAPRSPKLIADYVRHVGGNPREYRKVVPPHLFPQWTFGLASQLLLAVPYPLMRIVNGGCRLEINGPLPQGEPIEVTAQLENIDDNGRRAVMTQRLVSGTRSAPNAIEARMFAIVPLKSKSSGSDTTKAKSPKAKKPKARVPEDAKELTRWSLRNNAGLEFAALTGDFNPIHWIPPMARANGFKHTILHGFSTMARSFEGVKKHYFLGAKDIATFDVQFTRPLVLPARVGLYVRVTDTDHEVYVGDAPGGPAYMTGRFTAADG